jgi:glutaredoxin
MTAAADAVHVYWRRGCVFCSTLRRGLERAGVETVDHDIWADPAAAAVVRSHANGNETVPTVVIGDVAMVNPSTRRVLDHLERVAPQLLPEGFEHPRPGLLARLRTR